MASYLPTYLQTITAATTFVWTIWLDVIVSSSMMLYASMYSDFHLLGLTSLYDLLQPIKTFP